MSACVRIRLFLAESKYGLSLAHIVHRRLRHRFDSDLSHLGFVFAGVVRQSLEA